MTPNTIILTAAEMRALEAASDAAGHTYAKLMRNAGVAAARVIFERIRQRPGFDARTPALTKVLLLCGKGNNGGDGLVCAKELARLGVTPQIYLLQMNARGEPSPLTTFTRAVKNELVGDGVYVDGIEASGEGRLQRLGDLAELLRGADVVIDALLGTGLSRPITNDLRDVLREIAIARQPDKPRPPLLVAIDGVSGMNFDTGELDASAVPADLTITFHAPKRGHYAYPAAGAGGELVVEDIGIPAEAQLRAQPIATVTLANAAIARARLPDRDADANKFSNGRVLVIGGSEDFLGAPTLSAEAAYRAGAGLVTLVVPQSVKQAAAVACREATFITVPESIGFLHPDSLPKLAQWIEITRHIGGALIGPGMGRDPATRMFLIKSLPFFHAAGIPLVLDADALNMIGSEPDWHTQVPANSVLTPHAGEMARLTAMDVESVQRDRIGLTMACAQRWGHVVALKGAYTVIAAPDGRAMVMPFANPALATAGTGDVLAGCVLGLLSQRVDPFDAIVCAAYLNGMAADAWRAKRGPSGMLAGDLLAMIPKMVGRLRARPS